MFFKFFNELNKDNYSFKEFKNFCDKLSTILSIRKQKKLVKKAHDTYINALKGYDKIMEYGLEAIGDIEKCSDFIDIKGKKYFKNTINKEFSTAYIEALNLNRIKESDLILKINKRAKQILEYK